MKERLDKYLVKNSFFPDLDRARRAIMSGIVLVDDKVVDKIGTELNIKKEPNVRVKGQNLKYVSRGGLKLEKAISVFNLDFTEKIVLDVGASTGGFTDCALQNGAKFVYAVDVGTNQLDWKLRSDKRVKSIENRHICELQFEELDRSKIDFIVVDVSFISIKKILEDLLRFFSEETKLMILIKPQFEAEKNEIEKGGIVKDKSVHMKIIEDIVEFSKEKRVYLNGIDFSPITGNKGNIEYITLFSKNDDTIVEKDEIIKVVEDGQKLN